MNQFEKQPICSIRNRHLFIADAASVVIAALMAFAVRFEELTWIRDNGRMVGVYILGTLPLRMAIFYVAGLYRRLWTHASLGELRQILIAVSMAGLASGFFGIVVMRLPDTGGQVPFSVVFIDAFLTAAAIALPRLLARTLGGPKFKRRRDDIGKRVLLVGASNAAKLVVKELRSNPQLNLDPIGFVDDERAKHGQILMDLPIFGPLDSIRAVIEAQNVGEIIIAIPSAPGEVVRRVVRAALDCGIPTLTVPSLPEIIARKSAISLREVEIQDLLRREQVQTDLASVAALATGETVLITGAGGSIGSELCRQIGRLAPRRLIVLGHGENSIFDIQEELLSSFPDVEIVPVIADVRDRKRMIEVFLRLHPKTVFHAAAHKHVPLMEENVVEAITNNILGTRNVVDAALEARVEHFVLVSTDKAVRPTSVMGATKRVAELIVQHAAARHEQNFVSVRFGNVLGSRGSVVPTFMRQIRAGGPVTVTHPEMQRFFMTIPEAVQLVLQAGALGRGGEVFVLDMGEPVKIVDMATDLIRLSGLTVGNDIEIVFTGIRAGEKLYEEIFLGVENVIRTDHPKVLRARNGILPEGTMRRVDALMTATQLGESEEQLRQALVALVPDFHIPSAIKSDGFLQARPIASEA